MQHFLLKAATGAIAAFSLAEYARAILIEEKAKSKGCPYGYGKETLAQEEEASAELDTEVHAALSSIFEQGIEVSAGVGLSDYESIFGEMVKKFDSLSAELGANKNERGSFVGCLVRLAGHDFMDYRDQATDIGGSDGCIDLNEGDNKGLQSCINKFGITQIYPAFKDKVSLADFIVIIAEAAMARAHRGFDPADPFKTGSLAQKFRDGFMFGRKTASQCEWSSGRMPNPELGCHGRHGEDGLEQIFVDNIYKGRKDAWTLIAAINGAHTVGGAVLENSGYNGHWGTAEEQGVFNNDYYRSILAKGWIPEVAVNGNEGKNQWKRGDQPYNETAESLEIQRNTKGTMYNKLNQQTYDLHVERINDPKRGNYENPDEGIKGHHEMMLTSDMCLVYKKNKTFMSCYKNKDEMLMVDWKGHVGAQRMQDCRSNFWWEEFHTELYPEEANGCCAWASQNMIAGFGFQKWGEHPVTGKRVEYCGLDINNNAFLNTSSCCFNAEGGSANECSEKYYQFGPAYEDIVQFAANEDIWIRKFLEAWHIGTENGTSNLKWLEPKNAHDRLYQTAAHKVNCRGLTYPNCFRKPECKTLTVAQAPEASHHCEVACRNKFMLLSEQQNEGETFRNYREQYQATLVNPFSSSSLNELYPASNPLHRQDRVELKKQGKNYWTRSFPTQLADSTRSNPNNYRAQTSCAITKAVSTSNPVAWWQADFKEGDLPISEVEIWGEHYHTIWDRAMLGVKVYINDQLCNTIDDHTITEIFETMKKKEGNGFRVVCKEPITGNQVKLVSKNEPRTGETYTAGLTLCDIRVFTTAKEPVWNGHYKLDFDGTRDFTKYPPRSDYGDLLQDTSLGQGGTNVSMWEYGQYDVEDRN